MSSALARARARWRLRRQVGIWHHPGYAPCCLERSARRTSALHRAERVLAQLDSEGLLRPMDLRRPAPASFRDLGLAHTPSYLEDSGRTETLARVFALEPGTFAAGPLVEAQRLAVGGTIGAARAVAEGLRVGVNLGGGFHHAAPDRGGGFCVYNDVVAAVKRLRADGLASRMAVIDLDFHQGDGTLAALAGDLDVLQYSIHGAVWQHDGDTRGWQIALPAATGDAAYLGELRGTLPAALRRHRPTLAFYLAGNDVLADDPMGTFALTPRGVLERDRFVVRCAREAGVGLVVLMAGGYREDAWASTANLLRWLLCGAVRLDPPRAQDLHRTFEAFASGLDPAGPIDGSALTEDELMADLGVGAPAPLLLDFYTAHGLEYALERCGMLDRLRERGFTDLRLTVTAADAETQVVRLRGRPRGGGQAVVLVELSVARRRLPWPGAADSESPLDLLDVEWLLLQDPTASFSLERPPLPGQEHPGLGLAAEIKEKLAQACRRLGLDGVLMRPAHFHIAAGAAPDFRFLDPAMEGRLMALRAALSGHDVGETSALLDAGALRDAEDRPLAWEPAPEVLPVSDRLRAHFESAAYVEARDAVARHLLAGALHAVTEAEAAPAG